MVRIVGAEQALRDRVRLEIEQRGWSQDEFAREVRNLGVPMTQQTMKDFFTKTPPRRVKVEEMLAFARVLGITPLELVEPVGVAVDAHIARLTGVVREKVIATEQAWRELVEAWIDLSELAGRDDLYAQAVAANKSFSTTDLVPTFDMDDTRIGDNERHSEGTERSLFEIKEAVRRLLTTAGSGTRVVDGDSEPIATTWAEYRAWRNETAGLRGETRGAFVEAEWLDNWNMLTGYAYADQHTYANPDGAETDDE